MANFARALIKLYELEGLEADIKGDPGGETYRGIARNYHSDWLGWVIWDEVRAGKRDEGQARTELEHLATEFYRERYWSPLRAELVPSDAIGIELLEQAVHTNQGRAIEHLQEALNKCNDDGKKWPEVSVDGSIGPKTLASIKIACSRTEWRESVLKDMNILQAIYLRSRPGRENVYMGWLRRISIPTLV